MYNISLAPQALFPAFQYCLLKSWPGNEASIILLETVFLCVCVYLSLTSVHQDPTVVQSRVRRLIGRRRAGLDRYASILSREASQSHDYDPITELLSQLSSGE